MSVGRSVPTTTPEDWAKSDLYHNSFLLHPDPALDYTVKNSKENGLPDIAVSAAHGKFLNLVARSVGAKRILEVGTLGGYSAIWFGKALPEGGRLLSLDISEKHAKVARENIENAGLSAKIEVKVGPAIETLKTLSDDEPFDLVFIDADKPSNLAYFIEAKRLTRKGAVIIVDNVVRQGRVALYPEDTTDDNVIGVRKLLQHIKSDTDVDATTIATAGVNGFDGIVYAIRQ